MNLGICHKCLKAVRIVQQSDAAMSERWGGVDKLKASLLKGLKLFTDDSLQQYSSLDMTTLANTYRMVELEAVEDWSTSAVMENYCFGRHLTLPDLHRVGAQVLVPKSEGDELFALFFPIYRNFIKESRQTYQVVAAWTRHFYNTGQPLGAPWKYHSQSGVMLYDTALPTRAFGSAGGTGTLILVEGVADALRLNKRGWLAVALGGKHLTALNKVELINMPQYRVLIMLDKDALVQAVNLLNEVAAIKPKAGIVLIPQEDNANDPSELDDAALQTCLWEVAR